MADFRTELKLTRAPVAINLEDGIITQGSCFSDAIGGRFLENKFRTLVNPFGVIYNPESIHKVLSYATFNEPAPQHTFVHRGDHYLNYNFHSEFWAEEQDDLSAQLTNIIGSTHYFLKNCQWLIITYGTAWVYSRNDTGEIVANCHKLPPASFSKSLLTAEAIVTSFRVFFENLKRYHPGIKIILTVSPVRHLKDTLEMNSVSKSVLRVACHQIAGQFDDVDYFPAYEIMMDDLRDYRFYKADMLHPTTEAEDYVWYKFMERYFSPDLRRFVERWQTILSAMRHKPLHPGSSAHQQFLRDTLKKLEEFAPLVDVEPERVTLKQQIDTKR